MLLDEFLDVFQEEFPKELPPIRGIEHQINLILGSALPNDPPISVIQKKLKSSNDK